MPVRTHGVHQKNVAFLCRPRQQSVAAKTGGQPFPVHCPTRSCSPPGQRGQKRAEKTWLKQLTGPEHLRFRKWAHKHEQIFCEQNTARSTTQGAKKRKSASQARDLLASMKSWAGRHNRKKKKKKPPLQWARILSFRDVAYGMMRIVQSRPQQRIHAGIQPKERLARLFLRTWEVRVSIGAVDV